MDQFCIALAQLEPTLFDKTKNLAKAEEAIRLAAGHGAAAILFPELFLTGYNLGERAVEMAETREGASIRRVAELAGLHRIGLGLAFGTRHAQAVQRAGVAGWPALAAQRGAQVHQPLRVRRLR